MPPPARVAAGDHPKHSGIYNVGTGRSQTFNDVALAVINSLRRMTGAGEMTLAQAHTQGLIEYVPFPQALIGKYQSFTQADIAALRKAGYRREFLTVGQGVSRYLQRMTDGASHGRAPV